MYPIPDALSKNENPDFVVEEKGKGKGNRSVCEVGMAREEEVPSKARGVARELARQHRWGKGGMGEWPSVFAGRVVGEEKKGKSGERAGG
jgi:hypothetical protein